ncbi:unnamed protein product [Zymoseptoria tritici ST99CH_3D1]|nr:unnamed protein product [Zymoseptoria tritici ST99CH_3D1]
MHLSLPFLFLTSIFPLISADFLVANATACTGAFPINTCTHGVKVLSGTNNATQYTCDHLIRAQDNNYLSGGTAGPHGMNVVAKQGICDSGRLEFVKDGVGYEVRDASGGHLGDCTMTDQWTRSCNTWIGVTYFESMYYCTSGVCG